MKKLNYVVWMIISLLSFASTASAEMTELNMGSIAMDSPADMFKRFRLLTRYLSSKSGMAIHYRAEPDMDSTLQSLGRNSLQIAYLTPAAYLAARDKYQVEPLVNPLVKGKGTFTLSVAVRSDSPIKSLNDLKGKTFGLGDPKALLQPAVLKQGGILLSDLGKVLYLNHYDNIVKSLKSGEIDGGIVKDSVLADSSSNGLRVIYTSGPLQSYVFVVSKSMDGKTRDKLKKAFLSFNENNTGEAEAMDLFEKNVNGFEDVKDSDFDVIRKALDKVAKK